MDFGIVMFPTDLAIDPVSLGRAVEDRGFESLWFPEHSHIPTSRETPWGGREGAPPLPEEYWRTYDQFVALAMVAATTTTLKVASGISLVAQRDPLWLAKEVASLDALSGGRFLFGVGYGWNKEEMAHHGIAYTERRKIMREKIHMMKALWTQDIASFSGDTTSLDPSWAWPKPHQKPHPPIIMGGTAGPKTIGDICDYADGWMPIHGRTSLGGAWDEIRMSAAHIGRDPNSISLGVYAGRDDPEAIEECRNLGAERYTFYLPSAPADEVLPILDRLADRHIGA